MRIDGTSKRPIERQSKIRIQRLSIKSNHSIERFVQLVFSAWTAILLWEMDNPSPKDGSKPRTMGDMIDQVKMQALGGGFLITYGSPIKYETRPKFHPFFCS
jgi:hypothetical protein